MSSIENAWAGGGERFEYEYDIASNRKNEKRYLNGQNTRDVGYTYDPWDRLTGARYEDKLGGGVAAIAYGYDLVGNRTSETGTRPGGGAVNRTFAYDDLNQTTSLVDGIDPQRSATFQHDANGNLISETEAGGSVRQYAYDVRDQMTAAWETPAGGSQSLLGSYEYDYQKRRVRKTVGGQALDYIYNGINVVGEAAGGQLVARYDFGADLVRATFAGESGSRWYGHDALGSTTALVGDDNALAARYEYGAWGEIIGAQQPTLNKVGFTGYRLDDETGLNYAINRYYDPSTGRFTSTDPLTELHRGDRLRTPQGLNLYPYVMGNPTRYIDPEGYEKWVASASIENGKRQVRIREVDDAYEVGDTEKELAPVPGTWFMQEAVTLEFKNGFGWMERVDLPAGYWIDLGFGRFPNWRSNNGQPVGEQFVTAGMKWIVDGIRAVPGLVEAWADLMPRETTMTYDPRLNDSILEEQRQREDRVEKRVEGARKGIHDYVAAATDILRNPELAWQVYTTMTVGEATTWTLDAASIGTAIGTGAIKTAKGLRNLSPNTKGSGRSRGPATEGRIQPFEENLGPLPNTGGPTRNIDLALGVWKQNGKLLLKPFSKNVKKQGFSPIRAAHFRMWKRLGLYDKDVPGWGQAFRQAVDRTSGRLHFNLDGLRIDEALAGDPDIWVGRYTAWELQQIVRNRKWFERTAFYLDGELLSPGQVAELGIQLVDGRYE